MLDLAVVDAVPGAVVSVGTAAVVASVQVKAHRVVGTGVPSCLAFVNIYRRTPPPPPPKNRHHTYVSCSNCTAGGSGEVCSNKPIPNLSAATWGKASVASVKRSTTTFFI